ncbi:hypothetical protein [Haloarchaeobius sp. FL176]|uniref:hypothetical protein n=1 Tax=Haloarchaeobius sp. FL176 TaxID=2967129 RepID=UPI0021494027|nr:hypothetical protein [Haloarchaeobius sp. FL176]
MSDSAFDSGTPLNTPDYVSALQKGYESAQYGLRTIGFWAAVSLPFVHLPLLLTGLDSTADLLAFGVLLGSNLIALLVGHHHDSP